MQGHLVFIGTIKKADIESGSVFQLPTTDLKEL